ncbi:MAG: peptidoglycan binding domain-containing protein, partial [Candidatus Paceibacterota bacterium]
MKLFWKKVKIPFIILVSLLVLLSIIAVGLIYTYRDSVYPRVFVQGLDISSTKLKEAFDILDKKNKALSEKNIILTYGEQEYATTLEELGIKLNTDETLVQAYKVKRQGNILEIIQNLFKEADIPWVYTNDNEILESSLGAKVNPALKTLADAKLDYKDGQILIIPEQAGESLAVEKIATEIVSKLTAEEIKLEIPLNKVNPVITTASWEAQKPD